MTQQPNIPKRINSKVTEMNTSVPRSQGNLSDNTITTIDEEIFSIPSPDSGYALKLIKEFQPLWSQHYKKNLITKVDRTQKVGSVLLLPNIMILLK